MTVNPQDAWAGRVLSGRYRLLHPIGVGGSARVYLAEDLTLGRRVAVKVLHPGLANDQRFVERFRSEAQVVASLNCPQVLEVYDWGLDEEAFLVLEYLGGGSLRSLLDRGDRLSPSQALLVGIEAARGLAFAHERDLVHRDIKPDNLLFGSDARLRIADFGLARAVAEAGWTDVDGSLVGTVRYASPEQARGERVGPAGDVYALALVLNEAVTGEVPFMGDTALARLMARTETPFEPDPAVGPMVDLLSRAGSLNPDQRPSAAEFVDGLLGLAGGMARPEPLRLAGPVLPDAEALAPTHHGASSTNPDAPAEPRDLKSDEAEPSDPQRPKRRRTFLRSLVAMAVITAGILGYWYVTTPDPVVVPDLVGASRPEALVALDELGLAAVVEDVREAGSEVDVVVRTDPPSGEELAEGETVTLYVSIGQPLVGFPDVVGLTSEEARQTLEGLGLVVGVAHEDFSEDIEAGRVLSLMDPADGSDVVFGGDVEQGTVYDLRVSAGPEPRIIPEIPEDRSVARTWQLLEALGLVVVEARDYSDRYPEQVVISTDPAAGESVPQGGTVTLVVSDGPAPRAVPDVIGLDVREATRQLNEAGFIVDGVQGSPLLPVIASDPQPGDVLPYGSYIVLATSLR
jgi:beta-lactam-binding protein with PASTA domain/tRNA A-37 threonylcarbamoyl transferase component Bud32